MTSRGKLSENPALQRIVKIYQIEEYHKVYKIVIMNSREMIFYQQLKGIFLLIFIILILKGEWRPHPVTPWCNLDGTPAISPEDVSPPQNWRWVANWKVERQSGSQSSTGWEYATSLERFQVSVF